AGKRLALRPYEPHPARLTHFAGLRRGLLSNPPEVVRAHGAVDRATRVLREHEFVELDIGVRKRRRQEHRCAERYRGPIDRYRTARRQGYTQRALGPERRIAEWLLAEEHDTRVGIEQLLHSIRMGQGPLPYGGHRRLTPLELTVIDQILPDGTVGITILVRVVQPDRLAGRQPYPPRALHFQKESRERIVHPHDRVVFQSRVAGQVRSTVVRDDAAALEPRPDALTPQLRILRSEIHGQQIRRRRVKRRIEVL